MNVLLLEGKFITAIRTAGRDGIVPSMQSGTQSQSWERWLYSHHRLVIWKSHSSWTFILCYRWLGESQGPSQGPSCYSPSKQKQPYTCVFFFKCPSIEKCIYTFPQSKTSWKLRTHSLEKYLYCNPFMRLFNLSLIEYSNINEADLCFLLFRDIFLTVCHTTYLCHQGISPQNNYLSYLPHCISGYLFIFCNEI